MPEPIPPCPNCQSPWPPASEFCPNCGLQRPSAAWPPPPSNFFAPFLPPMPKLVTGRAWGDITLGIGLTLASSLVYCLGLIVMPILYFTLKPTYPVFTRGIGYGLLLMLVLMMGVLIACFSSSGSMFKDYP